MVVDIDYGTPAWGRDSASITNPGCATAPGSWHVTSGEGAYALATHTWHRSSAMKRFTDVRAVLAGHTPRTLIEAMSTRVFSVREIVLVSLVFVCAVPVLHVAMDTLNQVAFDGAARVSATWPINVFYFHILWEPLWLFALTVLAALVLFTVLVGGIIFRDDESLLLVAATGTLLVFATTTIQGFGPGFITPTAGGPVVDLSTQYYHDAITVTDPIGFLSEYSTTQPDLRSHSQTHPPGAVLTYYVFVQLLGSPALITAAIAMVAVAISAPALYGILTQSVQHRTALYTTLLYLLLPSIQIYYAGVLDALVTAFIIAAVYCFRCRPYVTGALGATAFLFLASFQTFMFLFALPVLVGYEVLREHTIHRSVTVVAGLAVVYGVLYAAFDFNYVRSFGVASAIHNPGGPLFLRNPAKYVTSRLMGVTEILVFFTPFLTWLLIRERSVLWEYRDLAVLFGLAVVTFLGQLATGALLSGETARAAMYLYPFLMFPLAAYFDAITITSREQFILATLVFGQTVAMQLAGFYFW